MAKVEVTMPQMGESITEGTIIAWHKKPGDRIELDETLLEIGTDKVDTEVPSPAAGIVSQILVEEGETVDVGTAVAIIETEVEEAETPEEKISPPEEDEETVAPLEDEVTTDSAPEEAPISEEAQVVEQPERTEAPSGALVEVLMPQMGESIVEGTIITWHKQPGDPIEVDETLLEIATDKVDTEVPSPAAGILKEILVQEGETVDVGTVIATIATGEAAAETKPHAPAAPAAAPSDGETAEQPVTPQQAATPSGDGADLVTEEKRQEPVPRKSDSGRFYSPLVRSIAEKEGISLEELEKIPGSGRENRLTKEDVLQYLEERKKGVPAAREVTPEPKKAPILGPAPAISGSGYEGRVEIVEMDRMRQIIAEHMVRSKQTSAHVTSFAEADVTNLVRLRENYKTTFEQREGIPLTFTPFFVKAVVETLRELPIFNASVEGNKIIFKKDLHIGIAVAIGKQGLVAPVIRNAGDMNVTGLARAASDLAQRARNKKLQPDEIQGGTFTVTNIGSLGSIMGTPIINQPQLAILATGAIKKRPVVIEDPVLGDLIAIRHMMYLSLTYDHRVIDGAMGAAFLQKYVSVLESYGPDMQL